MTTLTAARAACVVCGAIARAPAYRWNGDSLWRCASCRLFFRPRRASLEERKRYYTAAYYAAKPAYFPTTLEEMARHSRLRMGQRVLERLGRLRSPGRLLDGGCGVGAFLALSRQHGWQPYGVELSAHAAQSARRQFGAAVQQGDLGAWPVASACMDAVTLLDVLGECVDPRATLREAHRVLAAHGLLVVAVVDTESALYRLAIWSHRLTGGQFTRAVRRGFPADHTAFFSSDVLQTLLRETGFRVVRTERYDEGTEHVASFTPWWLRLPLTMAMMIGRAIGRPLELCVYAVKV